MIDADNINVSTKQRLISMIKSSIINILYKEIYQRDLWRVIIKNFICFFSCSGMFSKEVVLRRLHLYNIMLRAFSYSHCQILIGREASIKFPFQVSVNQRTVNDLRLLLFARIQEESPNATVAHDDCWWLFRYYAVLAIKENCLLLKDLYISVETNKYISIKYISINK